MRFDTSEILFFMTIEAELRAVFRQQPFFARLMRIVAGSTIAIARWIMLERRLGNRLLQVFMAFVAQFCIGLYQQLFVR